MTLALMKAALRYMAAFLLSAVVGALSGVVLIILLWNDPVGAEHASFYLVALFWGTLLSIPYVAAGLAAFGLPVTWWLDRHVRSPWFGLLAAVWGGAAGLITHHLFNQGRTGEDALGWLAGIEHLGIVYGVPTGIAWWLLYARLVRMRDREERDNG